MNPCNVVAQLVTTACYSRLDTDMLLVQRLLGPKSDHEKTTRIFHCAQRTVARFAWFSSHAERERKREREKREREKETGRERERERERERKRERQRERQRVEAKRPCIDTVVNTADWRMTHGQTQKVWKREALT